MNVNYQVGRTLDIILNKIVSHPSFPLTRYFPRGKIVWYDIQRFSDKKDLNIIFDVGANIGQTANGLIQYFPKTQIYCFEPVKSSFDILHKNFSSFSNISLLQQGFGSKSEHKIINIYDDSQLNTLIVNAPRDAQKINEEKIFLDTIDNFCLDNQIPAIDILKMDVQGWEMEILLGAMNFISQKKIKFIYTEVGFRRQDRDMQHFSEINDFLESQGYYLCGFYSLFRWGDHKQYLGFANALYVQPDYLEDRK
ncbi:FkbM family methyltransferase [Nodularia spumigena]|uniref:FkbM family methyltransferase n=1 Tax=Nodularia spumigena TaxID=70799 RepID=UPI00232C01E2|nr:FkbM family methyltransferase [Nodularia spumigena]MDB9347417.1 FkbM family methyltransferase [Nodularia spumigena CS-588/01]MDB9354463.1 FkbM family methyltransferase [Nodularia spumigena CS-588/05]